MAVTRAGRGRAGRSAAALDFRRPGPLWAGLGPAYLSAGMGKKKSGPKAAKTKEPKGDLRDVPALVEKYKAGDMSGAEGLMDLGRDAAFSVLALGEAKRDDELLAFGKKLIAVPPQLPTNLFELRRQSVEALLKKHKADAAPIENLMDVVLGNAGALFDPLRVAADLAKSGRPRRDPKRLEVGDLAWFWVPHPKTRLEVRLGPPPTGVPGVRLRLKVDSGLVFLGAPEASDGPRLGTVRLDPFSTGLEDHLGEGRLGRLKPGTYALYAYLEGPQHARVHLTLEEDPKAPLDVTIATQRGLLPPEVLARP